MAKLGLASNFLDLAHQKLRPGGVLALVLPLTFVSGGSWSAARELLARWYRDIAVIAIAATGSEDRAFSDDTGLAGGADSCGEARRADRGRSKRGTHALH